MNIRNWRAKSSATKVLWEALSAFLIYRLGLRAKVLGSSRFRPLREYKENNTFYTLKILTSLIELKAGL